MPLRSVKMKRFILGFQRRVWCPKWTPLSSSWRMVTTAMVVSPCGTRVPFLVVSPPVDGDLAPVAYDPLPAGRPGSRPYSALASYGNRRANSTSEKVVGPSLGHRTAPEEIHNRCPA